MAEIRKHALAEPDLIEIWLYTHDRQGEEQAERYFKVLEEGINQLGHPNLGQPCDHVLKGYRALQVNRHIFYDTVASESVVHIIRVLHEWTDPTRQIAES